MCITLQNTINSAFSEIIDSSNFGYENIRIKIRKISLFSVSVALFFFFFLTAFLVRPELSFLFG